MKFRRISKLQYSILVSLDGQCDYNSLAKYICVSYYTDDTFSMKKWLLGKEALPQKFAVSFTRSVDLLMKKGLLTRTRKSIYYNRNIVLELTKKGKDYIKIDKNFKPNDKKKGYKWI